MKKVLDNKIFKKVYGTFKGILVLILVLYVLFLAIQRFGNNRSIAGFRFFTIATGSMEPVYNVGDVILVENTSFSDLKVGDDITYMGETADFAGKIVTHRILSIDNEDKKITTQGIANNAPDPEINENQVLGKVFRKLIIFSFLTRLIRNKIGFYFLIFVPLVLVIFLEIADVVTTARSDEDEKEKN